MTSTIALIEQLKGRAKFYEDRFRVKSPQLFREAATELTTLLERCEKAEAALEQTKEECADFVKHWLIESDNEYAVEVAVECSHALLKWDGKS